MSHTSDYFDEVKRIAATVDLTVLDAIVEALRGLRARRGRLFIVGVGGSAANASHAVNDFRKLCGIEAYAPTDNVSELTARTNDEGWETVFAEWLRTSQLNDKDALLVFSVGGGSAEKNVSMNLVRAVEEAKEAGAVILGVVGRDGGFTAAVGDHVLIVPVVEPGRVTPHTEAFQSVIWHCLVSHPDLQVKATKW